MNSYKEKTIKFIFPILIIVAFNLNAYSQSLYQYFYGYEAGFHKACSCKKQIKKSNNLLYNSGTYNDGYNAGFIDGRIFNNQNNNEQKENVLYSPDYEMIERSLKNKQNLLNQRREQVKLAHENILEIIAAANERNKSLTESQKEYLRWYVVQIDEISKYDFSITVNFNNVMNWFQKVKTNVLKW
jgi:hypothetical protein